MQFYRFLKAALIFARYQAWVDEPRWEKADALALAAFLSTPTGQRLKAYLVNVVLRQQANAVTNTGNLVFEAGYCGGQRGLVAAITALADTDKFTVQEDTDADPATIQEAQ